MTKDLRKVDVEWRPFDFEPFGLDPLRAAAGAAGAGFGIDDPDGLDAHGVVILGALLGVAIGVVGGENLDD